MKKLRGDRPPPDHAVYPGLMAEPGMGAKVGGGGVRGVQAGTREFRGQAAKG